MDSSLARQLAGRPAGFFDLFISNGMNAEKVSRLEEANRFIVVNLEQLVDELDIAYSAAQHLLDRAAQAVKDETNWSSSFDTVWKTSKMQLQRDSQRSGKMPAKAATIIVALELAAHEKNKRINIYERTGILECNHFVDLFDTDRLNALTRHYDSLSEADRAAKFGESARTESFEDVCLKEAGQPFSTGLLAQMAKGDCAPQKLCGNLVNFINQSRFPKELHVGAEALESGDERARNLKLGRGNAAKALRYSKNIDIAKL